MGIRLYNTRVNRFCLLAALLLIPARPVIALETSTAPVIESSTTPEMPEQQDQTTSTQESESKGTIIPPDADTLISTGPITPTSIFPAEKAPYVQGHEELLRAMSLWAAGHSEAASDTALEAYDDLIELRRAPGVKRIQIRAEVRQAAGIYVQAGIAYIRSYVRRMGSTAEAIEEGRGRLEDLGDVAHNYKDLNKMLNSAIEQILNPNKTAPAAALAVNPPEVNPSTVTAIKISTNSLPSATAPPVSTSSIKTHL
jgi:hypothetical protein